MPSSPPQISQPEGNRNEAFASPLRLVPARDRRIDFALFVAVFLTIGLLSIRGLGLIGADETGDGLHAPSADEAIGGEDAESDAHPPRPTPGPAPLEWSPGIQTWLHWYDRGIGDPQLRNLDAQGFGWVKQRFAWADMQPVGHWSEGTLSRYLNRYGDEDYPSFGPIDWSHSDAYLDAIDRVAPGTHVLIQLDVPPEWALWEDPEDLIPGEIPYDSEAWSDFVYFFAQRYAGRVHAYEIGNEPNLRHPDSWPSTPDPEAYAWMLRDAHSVIDEADPHALVISAGLSPTGDDGMPDAMADDLYLEALYDAMEEQYGAPHIGGTASDFYFDALGAHAPGFRAAPEVSPDEAAADPELGGQRLFTFRRVEDLRAVMDGRGDGEKPIVITELSWTTDPRPQSPYHWSAVDGATRADYIVRALDYAAEHWTDWIGPIFLFSAPDRAWTGEHEAYWRAVTDDEGWLKNDLRLPWLGTPTALEDVQPEEELGVEPDVEPDMDAGYPGVVDNRPESGPLPVRYLDTKDMITRPGDGTPLRWAEAPTALAMNGHLIAMATGDRLRIADMSDPTSPSWIYESEAFPGKIESLHLMQNMRLTLFVAGAFGLRLLDVSDPRSPEPFASSDQPMRIVGMTGEHLYAVALACVSPPCIDLLAIELHDVIRTHVVGAVDPDPRRWAVHDGYLLKAMTGEMEGHVAIYDLRHGEREEMLTEPVGTLRVGTRVHALTPFDQGVVAVFEDPTVSRERAYGRKELGLRTLDLSNPSWQPRWNGTTTIEVSPGASWFGGAGPFVAVVDSSCHVGVCSAVTTVVDLNDPTEPRVAGAVRHPPEQWPAALALEEAFSAQTVPDLLVDMGTGLGLYRDIAATEPPETLSAIGVLPLPLPWSDPDTHVAAIADGAIVMTKGTQLQVLAPLDADRDAAASPVLGTLDDLACAARTRTIAMDIAIAGDLALIAGWEAGLIVVDISDPSEPRRLGCFMGEEQDVRTVTVDPHGDPETAHVYLAGLDYDDQRSAVRRIDVSDPTSPATVVEILSSREGLVSDLAVDDGIVYLAAQQYSPDARPQGLHVLDLRDPAHPEELAPPLLDLPAEAVAAIDGLVALSQRRCTRPEGSPEEDCRWTVALFTREGEGAMIGSGIHATRSSALEAQARYVTGKADLLLLPAGANGDPPELWLADTMGVWALGLAQPESPSPVLVSWDGARRLVPLPRGELLIVGEQGVIRDSRMASWE